MTTLPHTPASAQDRPTGTDLSGDHDTTPSAPPAHDWPQAVQQVEAALCTTLRLAAPPERIRNALDLVLAHAVTLHDDGSASVQSGGQTFILAPHCACTDATQRPEWCLHALAVELHRRAAQRMDAAREAPASASGLCAPFSETPPSLSSPASGTGTTAWLVQEAPVSACFTWRVGQAELLYTFRGLTDDAVLDRIQAYLPRLQAILAACDPRSAEPAAPTPETPASPPQDATPAPAPGQRQRPTGDHATGWCSLHDVAMQKHSNDRGTWYSHPLGQARYCKGAK